MDTSSESDSFDRTPGRRSRGRETHRRPGRDGSRGSGSGGDDRTADISKKISTLANTLQVLYISHFILKYSTYLSVVQLVYTLSAYMFNCVLNIDDCFK